MSQSVIILILFKLIKLAMLILVFFAPNTIRIHLSTIFLKMAEKFKIITKCKANEVKVKVLTSDLAREKEKVQAATDERSELFRAFNKTTNKHKKATSLYGRLRPAYRQLYDDYFKLKESYTNIQTEYFMLHDEVTALKLQARINEDKMSVLSNNLNAEKAKVTVGKEQICVLNTHKVELENHFEREKESYCHLEKKYINEQTNYLNTVAENARLQEDTECSVCFEKVRNCYQ